MGFYSPGCLLFDLRMLFQAFADSGTLHFTVSVFSARRAEKTLTNERHTMLPQAI
jgi:hypothetical protein